MSNLQVAALAEKVSDNFEKKKSFSTSKLGYKDYGYLVKKKIARKKVLEKIPSGPILQFSNYEKGERMDISPDFSRHRALTEERKNWL